MTTREHAPRLVRGGTRPTDVRSLLAAVGEVLDDPTARPLLPLAADAPDAEALLARLRTPAAPGTALVVRTSGSTTGAGHLVALPGAGLRASAEATHDRLDGPGQWLACLPTEHIAGLQVLVRSVVARTTPVVLDTSAGFRPDALAAAVPALRTDVPTYLSLVPTQLRRVLDSGAHVVAPLRRFRAILLGGARTPAALLERAAAAGLRVVTTYGMTETGGGCVYDGVPLPGVEVRTDDDGRVLLAGQVLATGYLDDPAASAEAFVVEGGRRWLRTADRGVVSPDGRLSVSGRLDDVLLTGGINVSAGEVERALADAPSLGDAVVVGVPDEEWGTLVVVVAAGPVPDLTSLREHVAARLGRHAAPRALVVLDALPTIGPGKVDRRSAARLAVTALRAPQNGPAGTVARVERHG